VPPVPTANPKQLTDTCESVDNSIDERCRPIVFMLFGCVSQDKIEQDRSSERCALLNRLSEVSREAFPEVEVLIYETSPSFNAQAFSVGGQQIVTLFGGLAFNRCMGKDGLLFTILHEIGHHLASGPRITRTNTLSCDCAADRWAIVEGQGIILSHGLTLDIKSALREIEAAISELGGASVLTAGRWCFDWTRRKVTLSSRFLVPLLQCEYRICLDNAKGEKNGNSDSERR
jgi:hypothetical protein